MMTPKLITFQPQQESNQVKRVALISSCFLSEDL